ncbi:MAG: STAS domain-containing protein [Victivallaceae bacterium]|nr:STAS domain-containing protein [Victivallaceae bacterium]
MEITRIDDDNGVTLRLHGCLDTAAAAEFATALEATGTAKRITLDMKELEFIASSALRLLVATRKKRGNECEIVLSGVNDVVGEVLDVTGLNEVFTVVK